MLKWRENYVDKSSQKKCITVGLNGEIEGKTMYVEADWTFQEFLNASSSRLNLVPVATRAFNVDGTEIDDCMMIEDDGLLFISSGEDFVVLMVNIVDNNEEHSSQRQQLPALVAGYKVSKLLGRGAFGEVRVGEHQLTQEAVALKFLKKSEIMSIGAAERTATEIQCLTTLKHQNIIILQQHVETPNHIVLIFELMEGGDLFKFMCKRGSTASDIALPMEEARMVFHQIVSGISFAHSQHICHRDLKLENILLKSNSLAHVKLADFGLSDFYRPGSTMKSNCGTLSFLAPEVFRGTSNAGPPLDVWSLGVILFAIIRGRLPFEGIELSSNKRPRDHIIKGRILKCQYKLDDDLGPEVKDLIRRMLKLDPDERATMPEIFNHCWLRYHSSPGAMESSSNNSSSNGPSGRYSSEKSNSNSSSSNESNSAGGGGANKFDNSGGGGNSSSSNSSSNSSSLSISQAGDSSPVDSQGSSGKVGTPTSRAKRRDSKSILPNNTQLEQLTELGDEKEESGDSNIVSFEGNLSPTPMSTLTPPMINASDGGGGGIDGKNSAGAIGLDAGGGGGGGNVLNSPTFKLIPLRKQSSVNLDDRDKNGDDSSIMSDASSDRSDELSLLSSSPMREIFNRPSTVHGSGKDRTPSKASYSTFKSGAKVLSSEKDKFGGGGGGGGKDKALARARDRSGVSGSIDLGSSMVNDTDNKDIIRGFDRGRSISPLGGSSGVSPVSGRRLGSRKILNLHSDAEESGSGGGGRPLYVDEAYKSGGGGAGGNDNNKDNTPPPLPGRGGIGRSSSYKLKPTP